MKNQSLGRGQDDALERTLTTLYRHETPQGLETAWRDAVRREGRINVRERWEMPRWRAVLPALAAVVLVAGTLATGALDLGGGHQSSGQQNGEARRMDGPMAKMAVEDSAFLYAEADAATGGSMLAASAPEMDYGVEFFEGAQSEPVSAERKIVRTASLTLATTAFDRHEEALRSSAAAAGGYVENLYQYGDGGTENLRRLTLSLRIPMEKLDAFLAEAAGIGRLTARSESAQDLTVSYSDTALRLKTQRTKLERLQALLAQAESVENLLQIENELANTQYTIDSFETSLRDIDRQVEKSAVTVTLVEETPAESAAAAGESLGGRMKNALEASLKGIGRFFQNMLVFLTIAAPVIILLAAAGTVAGLVARARRKKRQKNQQTEIEGGTNQ